MTKPGFCGALLLTVCLLVVPVSARQDATPTLTTDDVLRTPESTTNVNAAAEEEAAREADAAKAGAAGDVTAGYARVVAPSGYTFERPDGWKPVENLESKGAPSFFKYDGVFQDPKTGAVISAVSVDRSQLESPIDVSDEKAVNQLLSTMLNPANAKQGVKIFRRVSGDGPGGTKWLRIKAQGNGQSVDGKVVDTTFWVQIVQSDKQLALVAVGYPTAQQDAVSLAAFHTVRTLEMNNASGPAPAPEDDASGKSGAGKAPTKKDGAGRVRKQQ